jgi:ABC-type antimicrobial peptide transport system permease subunit
MKTNGLHPPKWCDRFLEWYCDDRLLEEIQGDSLEIFYTRVEEEGISAANRKYAWDVLRFLRWSNVKKVSSNYQPLINIAMFKNYLKIGFRNLLKNRVPSAINVFGLSLSIACAIVVFIFLDFQYNMDSYHKNSQDIYQVTNWVKQKEDLNQWGRTPALLSNSMSEDFDQIQDIARVHRRSAVLKYKDEVFNETVSFADPSFLTMFSFPLQSGNAGALNSEKSVVISNNIAIKYFGYDNPVGQELEIIFDKNHKEIFLVAAIADKLPANSSFGFEVLIPFMNYEKIYGPKMSSWENYVNVTFVQMQPGKSPDELLEVMNNQYVDIQNKASEDWKIDSFSFVALTELAVSNHALDYGFASGSHPSGRIALSVIAIFLLLLSCLNYMNIAIVSASGRLKEIGLRKVVGGRRTEIINQFLVENILVCFISLLFGISLAYFLFLPGFNTVLPVTIPFAFSSPVVMVSFFLILVLVVGVISGAYPAFYISAFKPVDIFRGKQKFGKKNMFSKIFLVFQFVLAFMTILTGIIFTENAIFQSKLDWGYNPNQIVSIPIEGEKHFNELYDKFNANPKIVHIAGSQHQIGRGTTPAMVEFEKVKLEARMMNIGPNYFETMNLRLVKGNTFSNKESSNDLEAIMINQAFEKAMNWDGSLERKIKIEDKQYYVLGVVEDFRYWSFYNAIEPCILRITDESEFNYISFQTNSTSTEEMDAYVKNVWKEVEPDLPYEGFYQNQVFERFFTESEANMKLMFFISGMALVLACMGLYGLVSFNITRKMKDFSVRKILGANMWSITKILNNDFIWYLVIAGVIGAPISYYLMDILLHSIFEVVKPMNAFPFVIAITAVIFTAYITIASQIMRVAKNNPTDTLRSE